MSLRLRILTAILAVNAAVLGVLVFLSREQNRRYEQARAEELRRVLSSDLERLLRDFAAKVSAETVGIRPILEYGAFDLLCRDALIVDNPIVADPRLVGPEQARYPYVQINPLGAVHREPSFSRSAVMAGIREAMDRRRVLVVQGGFCMPIQTSGGRIVGGGWFLPRAPALPEVPVGGLLVVLGLGILVLGGVVYIGLDRWVLRPVGRLSEAAALLEAGKLGENVDVGPGAREIRIVGHSLNRASRLLADQERRLARAVSEAEARARARERELILSGRLAAMGTLAAGIAHEINNPLAGMLNAVRRLKKEAAGGRAGVYLDLLEDGIRRIETIVRRTLEFAPRTSAPVVFAVGPQVEKARAMVEHRLEKLGVGFRREGGDDAFVRGDPHEFVQVFLNLFLNSLDAFEEHHTQNPEIRVRFGRGGGSIRIVVEDNGPGAPVEALDRIFDPFFSTKAARGDGKKLPSGLGLSISYAIVDHHGGRMLAEAPQDGGFRIVIEVPPAETAREGGSGDPPGREPTRGRLEGRGPGSGREDGGGS